MKVYVVRHGDAADAAVDGERPLSDFGRSQIERISDFLRSKSIRVDSVWHSTKLRARQTAEMLHEAIGGELSERKGLSPNDSAVETAGELRHWPEEDVCIVSHLPFVSLLASELLAGSPVAAWNFGTAAVLCLEREPTGRWWANWFISPDMLSE